MNSTPRTSVPERRQVVVVGGGLAGLTAAWELRHHDVVLLEESQRIGGRVWSERRGDYWLNFGAHVFGGSDTETGRVTAEAGVTTLPVRGTLTALAYRGCLITSGRVETYPLRLPLAPSERVRLARTGIKLRRGVAAYDRATRPRVGEDPATRRARTLAFRNDQSFADWLGAVPQSVDALLRVTVSRSSAEPEQLAAGHGIGYFHLVWRPGQGLSHNVAGGSSQLAGALAGPLGDRVVTGARVSSVTDNGQLVDVEVEHDGRERRITADRVVVATPSYVTRRIVVGLPRDLADALESIPYGPYVVVALHTRERGPMPWDDVYAIGTPEQPFNMVFNMASVLRPERDRAPGGSLMVYSGGPRLADPLLDLEDGAIVDRYLTALDRIFPETRSIVEEAVVQRWPRAIPYPAPGRAALQPALETPMPRIHLAGDYLGTWYSETAMSTGAAAGRAARDCLPVPPGSLG